MHQVTPCTEWTEASLQPSGDNQQEGESSGKLQQATLAARSDHMIIDTISSAAKVYMWSKIRTSPPAAHKVQLAPGLRLVEKTQQYLLSACADRYLGLERILISVASNVPPN